jgi:hypothetical protein
MASMTRCALDEAQVASIVDVLTASGLSVEPPRVLSLEESGKAAAWILVARRRA